MAIIYNNFHQRFTNHSSGKYLHHDRAETRAQIVTSCFPGAIHWLKDADRDGCLTPNLFFCFVLFCFLLGQSLTSDWVKRAWRIMWIQNIPWQSENAELKRGQVFVSVCMSMLAIRAWDESPSRLQRLWTSYTLTI